MTAAGVFVLKDDGALVAMRSAEFVRESEFQALLSKFPALLAGDQMNQSEPRRFMLIDPEFGVPETEGGGRRWSLDHLFIDQDAIPTLVEVKRRSDSRVRREVIGQLLEYAANGVKHWPPSSLRLVFEARCAREDRDCAEELLALLGPEADPEAFWTRAGENLLAGRIRLVLVADEVPQETRRIIEFLNVQMSPAEVLAVELRQYAGEGLRALAPLVIGQTQEAVIRKQPGAPRWTEAAILAAQESDPAAHASALAIMAWSRQNAQRVVVNASGSMGPVFVKDGENLIPFLIDASGRLGFWLGGLAGKPVFGDPVKRQAFLHALIAEGVTLPPDAADKRPSVMLSSLTPQVTQGLLRALDGFKAALSA